MAIGYILCHFGLFLPFTTQTETMQLDHSFFSSRYELLALELGTSYVTDTVSISLRFRKFPNGEISPNLVTLVVVKIMGYLHETQFCTKFVSSDEN
jgi:hypothetical protein